MEMWADSERGFSRMWPCGETTIVSAARTRVGSRRLGRCCEWAWGWDGAEGDEGGEDDGGGEGDGAGEWEPESDWV